MAEGEEEVELGKDRLVQAKDKKERGQSSNKICSFCRKSSHIVDTCYKKHGYPTHLKQKSAAINHVTTKDEIDELK